MNGVRDVTFLCGRAGVCALGAVAAKHVDNCKLFDYYLSQFKEVKISLADVFRSLVVITAPVK